MRACLQTAAVCCAALLLLSACAGTHSRAAGNQAAAGGATSNDTVTVAAESNILTEAATDASNETAKTSITNRIVETFGVPSAEIIAMVSNAMAAALAQGVTVTPNQAVYEFKGFTDFNNATGVPYAISVYTDTAVAEATEYGYSSSALLSDYLFVNDPIERFNRTMFYADEGIYWYFLRPIGKGYAFVVPLHVRKGIRRMDNNFKVLPQSLNNLLQAKFKRGGIVFCRFLINSTLGLVGFYDPALAWFGMERYDEDTGQTLATWHVGPGCYVYLPIFGSMTVRDGLGSILDQALDLRTAIPVSGGTAAAMAIAKINNLTFVIFDVDRLLDDSLDPYSSVRSMWYLMRTAEIDY